MILTDNCKLFYVFTERKGTATVSQNKCDSSDISRIYQRSNESLIKGPFFINGDVIGQMINFLPGPERHLVNTALDFVKELNTNFTDVK